MRDTGDMAMAIPGMWHQGRHWARPLLAVPAALQPQPAADQTRSPRGSKYLTLKPPRWHLCRGRCRGWGVLEGGCTHGGLPRTPTPWGSQGFPTCQQVCSALSIAAGSPVPLGGTEVPAGGQAWESGPFASIPLVPASGQDQVPLCCRRSKYFQVQARAVA